MVKARCGLSDMIREAYILGLLKPSGSQLIYYHKPIDTDFNNDVMKAEIYINTKLREKQRKGYVATNANRFNAAKCSFYTI